jgi:hypothetical protein
LPKFRMRFELCLFQANRLARGRNGASVGAHPRTPVEAYNNQLGSNTRKSDYAASHWGQPRRLIEKLSRLLLKARRCWILRRLGLSPLALS